MHSSLPRVCSLFSFFLFPHHSSHKLFNETFFQPKIIGRSFYYWERTGTKNSLAELKMCKKAVVYYLYISLYLRILKGNKFSFKENLPKHTYSFASVVPSSSKVSKSFCKVKVITHLLLMSNQKNSRLRMENLFNILFLTSNHQTTNLIFPKFFHKFFSV